MGKDKVKPFDGIYSALEFVAGNAVLYDKNGAPSVIFEVTNPVQKLCTDSEQYIFYHDVLSNIIQTLGEGFALQKQDIFCKLRYEHEPSTDADFLSKSYFKFFKGRDYTDIKTYLIVTQEANKSRFIKYDPKKWKDFLTKIDKVDDILRDKGIGHRKLSVEEVNEYIHRFFAFDFSHKPFSVSNFKASDSMLKLGDKVVKSFSIVDIDEVNTPTVVSPFAERKINGYPVAEDFLSFLSEIPNAQCCVYNQVIQVPNQRKLIQKLQSKAKRHGSLPDASNKIAEKDILDVIDLLATENLLLVHTNLNLLVGCLPDKLQTVTSYLETKFYDHGITLSKSAFNQLELFRCSFPGNAFTFNPEYDLFLTLHCSALCFFFKEKLKESEETPLTTYYTDRYGVPVCIDITGKEGKTKFTNNANFFCIGPSGSGKSFHMHVIWTKTHRKELQTKLRETS